MIDRLAELLRGLRERRAVRYLIPYLVSAWILAQVVGFFVEQGYVGRRLLDVTLFLLVVGFVAVAVAMWNHGARGDQPARRTELILFATLTAFGAAGSMWLATRPVAPRGAPVDVFVQLGDSSIAVLPFQNEITDPSMAWLDRGVADLLATNLSQLPHLRIVGGQRLFDLMRQMGQEDAETVPEDLQSLVARRAGARYMVTGRIAGSAANVVVIATLADAETGEIAGGARSQGRDVFALIDRVTTELLPEGLGAPAGVEPRPVAQITTRSLEAYAAFQQGREARLRFLMGDAERHFRTAVELDPTFALAHFQLAGVQAENGDFADSMVSLRFARENLTSANERDRLFIEGLHGLLEGDFVLGESLLVELIGKYPDDKEARLVLAQFLRGSRRDPTASRRYLEEALRLDPLYGPAYNELAYDAARRGDYDSATVLIDAYVAIEPSAPNPLDSRGEILEMAGRGEAAREAFRSALAVRPDFTLALEHLVESYLRDGLGAEARRVLAQPIRSDDPAVRVIALQLEAQAWLWDGDFDAGIAAYGRAAAAVRATERPGLRANGLRSLLFALVHLGRHSEARVIAAEIERSYPAEGAPYMAGIVIEGEEGRPDGVRRESDRFDARFRDDPNMAPFLPMIRAMFDSYVAFYGGDYDRVPELALAAPFAERGLGTDYLGFPVMRSLLALDRAEASVKQVGVVRRAGVTGSPGLFDPLVERLSLYYEGRARELAGEPEAAASAYRALIDAWGDSAREVHFVSDVFDRLAAVDGSSR